MDIKEKIKKYLWNIIQELLKEKIKIGLVIVFLFIISSFQDNLILILKYNVPIWIVIIFVVIIILLYLAFLFTKRYYESKSSHNIIKYGLEWHVNIKKNKINSIKGPFCSRCKYELSESPPFQCHICNTDYTTKISDGRSNLKEDVKKIIEAELRDGKMLILDWFLLSYPNSILIIRNNGASRMDNVEIKINLIYDGKKDIGSYMFDKINADDKKQILNPNPMVEIHNILKELNLVEINDEVTGMDVVDDEMGIPREVPEFITWILVKKSFSCQLEVNINYSIRNKPNIENCKYILKFNQLPPWEVDSYQDNCEIDLIESEK